MFPPRALHSKTKTADRTEQRTWTRERVLDYLEGQRKQAGVVVISATSALRKLRQENHEFQASLCYMVSHCLKN